MVRATLVPEPLDGILGLAGAAALCGLLKGALFGVRHCELAYDPALTGPQRRIQEPFVLQWHNIGLLIESCRQRQIERPQLVRLSDSQGYACRLRPAWLIRWTYARYVVA